MVMWFKKLFAAPVFEDEDKTRAASLVNAILLIVLALMIVFPPITAIAAPSEAGITSAAGLTMGVIVLGLLFLTRRGHVRAVSVLLTGTFLVMVTWSIYSYRGVRDLTITGYFLVIALAGLLLGGRAVILFGLICVLAALGVFYAETSGVITVSMEDTITLFQLITLIVTLGLMTLLLRFAVGSIAVGFSRARRSAQALAESNRALAAGRDALAVRTHDLERRSRYQAASAEVGRVVNTILAPRQLMTEVVELIREAFDLYYVGLFTLDETDEWAVLRAGTGAAGQAMLARGHRLPIGSGSMIGWSIANAQARIALDADADDVRLVAPELPDTRSEAALLLRSRGQVIGALTVQSDQPGAFDQDTVVVLQTLADQVAVALDNARLFAESQQALESERRAYGEISRKAWAERLRARTDWGYRYAHQSITPAEGDWRPEMLQAARAGQSVPGDSAEGATLAIPLKARDQIVGVLNFCKGAAGEPWAAEEVALLETLADQLGMALESARLYEDSQRRATHERLIGEVTARMRETLDVDIVLKTAAQEVRQALELPEVVIRLTTRPENDTPDRAAQSET